ncbi:MAG: aminotransferase class I/II-fold pyridoxal phosphate-dependent enzyme [Parasporobacterium sp.]|nr:aminotransferase class I/II-fold pyridoxal phosphate-dependent enzyme [Parasporobacterium sp.]
MKYDFTSILDRKGRDAIALDALGKIPGFAPGAPKEGFDAIPMWVADMNFPVCPSITEAISRRVSHPSFGYFSPREEYYESIIKWQRTRNHVEGLDRSCIGYENGVLGGVIAALNVFCSRGDKVLVHSPTYIGFTNSLGNNGYQIVHSPLRVDAEGVWRMDLEDMEKKIRKEKIHAAIFCSPHNPTGRVWERKELEQMMELFRRYDVYVVSDEIWSDLILEGYQHIPLQSVSEDARMRTAAFYAPSKTFNLAGLVGSYHIVYNTWMRERLRKESSLSLYNEMNVLSMHALIGAYHPEGYEWVDELNQVLTGNVAFACQYIRDHFEGVRVCQPQGTYMLFVDCKDWCRAHHKTIEDVEHACWDVGAAVQDGQMFHGPCHLRMNLALPRARVEEAFERMNQYVFNKREV